MNTSWALVPVFAPGLYTCTMTLQPTTNQQTRVLSVSMTNLLVKAGLVGSVFTGEQVSNQLTIEPGLYSDQTELLLSNMHPSAEFTVYGPPAVLSTIEVRSGSGNMHHNITPCQQVDERKHIFTFLRWRPLLPVFPSTRRRFSKDSPVIRSTLLTLWTPIQQFQLLST